MTGFPRPRSASTIRRTPESLRMYSYIAKDSGVAGTRGACPDSTTARGGGVWLRGEGLTLSKRVSPG